MTNIDSNWPFPIVHGRIRACDSIPMQVATKDSCLQMMQENNLNFFPAPSEFGYTIVSQSKIMSDDLTDYSAIALQIEAYIKQKRS